MRDVKEAGVSSISNMRRSALSSSQDEGTKAMSPFLFLTSFVRSFLVDDGFGKAIFELAVVMPSLRRWRCSRMSTSIVRFAG
jgi:hypothetical protein